MQGATKGEDRAPRGASGGAIKMSRKALYLVIGLLAAGVLVVGYLYYQESRSRSGIEIEIGEHGVSIEER
jgi:hypothetical protein